MKIHLLQCTQILPTSLPQAWDFFSSPANLPLITPPSLGFRITSALPERMYPGMLVTYTVTPFPLVRCTWVTEITHVDEPRFFVDEQRFGPYRLWHHEHHFREVPGGVEMTGRVSYALPLGLLGDLAAGALVERRLAGIFGFRREILSRRIWGPPQPHPEV
ncbi:MAG TPA: SRPBCC family protein [Verrucomicrobiae bacterium]|nr:SRPBCC family protein [Verrucomicrobiae bacterium]